MSKIAAIAVSILMTGALGIIDGWTEELARGRVYWDKNKNGIFDGDDSGIPGICVSNGKEVVQTGRDGSYRLPAYEEMVLFVVKPSGWMTPLDKDNIPKFSYVHKPKGSPAEIQRFRGISPTGPLPGQINFALYKVDESSKFRVAVAGDPQVYNDTEIDYLRDSLVKEVRASQAQFCITEGDNVGDDLSLFPRYLSVMGKMGIPVYYVPGNHDMNLDAREDKDSLDTFKNYIGATYYSFNYGKVHFVVLDAMEYPSKDTGGSYAGKVDATQLQWLANDLSFVPMDHLIVLNLHIPLVSDINRSSKKHQVENRKAINVLLKGRRAISLAGHTHTVARFFPGDQLDGWGEPTPIEQTIVGAASGSWWSGNLDKDGVPLSYMRCGAPRGHMNYDFEQSNYIAEYKAHARPRKQQMHLSFLNESFFSWYDAISKNNSDYDIANVSHLNFLTSDDLTSSLLVANIWAASKHDQVFCRFDDRRPVQAKWRMDLKDPYALTSQLYVTSAVAKVEESEVNITPQSIKDSANQPLAKYYWTVEDRSTHLWHCTIPQDLEPGYHSVSVEVQDAHGRMYEEIKTFEVSDS